MFHVIVLVEFDLGSQWIPLNMHYFHDGAELVKCNRLDETKPFENYEDALNAAKELSESDYHNIYGVVKGVISKANIIHPEEMSDDAYHIGKVVKWMDYV